jgi:NADH-quinone oxidoreductase subunit L
MTEIAEHFQGAASMGLHGISLLGPFGLVVLAFVIQTYIYLFNPAVADRIKRALMPLWIVLDRKYWMDDIQYALFGSGGIKLGRLFWKVSEATVIDGAMVNGSAGLVRRIAAGVRRLQSGYLYHYAFAMILGLILLLGGFWLMGSGPVEQ